MLHLNKRGSLEVKQHTLKSAAYQRGCADGREMVSVAVHPPPSGRRRLLRLGLHLGLIRVIVDVIASLAEKRTRVLSTTLGEKSYFLEISLRTVGR